MNQSEPSDHIIVLSQPVTDYFRIKAALIGVIGILSINYFISVYLFIVFILTVI